MCSAFEKKLGYAPFLISNPKIALFVGFLPGSLRCKKNNKKTGFFLKRFILKQF
jgi:hypothetical protein